MKYLLLTFLFFAQTSDACNSRSEIHSVTKSYDYESCTALGYCTMYDYNPTTETYEVFYGAHNNCPGKNTIVIEDYVCRGYNGHEEYEYTKRDVTNLKDCIIDR